MDQTLVELFSDLRDLCCCPKEIDRRHSSTIMAHSVAGLDPVSSAFFPGTLQGWRAQLYLLLEEPESGYCAKYLSLFIMTTILMSIVRFIHFDCVIL